MFNFYGETNLVGILEEDLNPGDTAGKARFFSKNNTSEARIPEKQELKLTLARGSEKQEEILITSHTEDNGIISFEISERKLAVTGTDMTSDESGFYHPKNTAIESVTGHFPLNILEAFLNGVIANSAGVKMIKDGVGSKDTTFILEGLKTAPHPFIRFKHPDNGGGFSYSENGVDSTPFGTGAGITTGDGIDLTDGVLSLLLKSGTPLLFEEGKLSIVTTDTSGGIAGKTVITGVGGVINKTLLQTVVENTALSTWGGKIDVAPSAAQVKAGFDNILGDSVASISFGQNFTVTKDSIVFVQSSFTCNDGYYPKPSLSLVDDSGNYLGGGANFPHGMPPGADGAISFSCIVPANTTVNIPNQLGSKFINTTLSVHTKPL